MRNANFAVTFNEVDDDINQLNDCDINDYLMRKLHLLNKTEAVARRAKKELCNLLCNTICNRLTNDASKEAVLETASQISAFNSLAVYDKRLVLWLVQRKISRI